MRRFRRRPSRSRPTASPRCAEQSAGAGLWVARPAGRPDRGRRRARGALSNRCRGWVAGCAAGRVPRSRRSRTHGSCGGRGRDSREVTVAVTQDRGSRELTVAVAPNRKPPAHYCRDLTATGPRTSRSSTPSRMPHRPLLARPRPTKIATAVSSRLRHHQDRDSRELTVAVAPNRKPPAHYCRDLTATGPRTSRSSTPSCGVSSPPAPQPTKIATTVRSRSRHHPRSRQP